MIHHGKHGNARKENRVGSCHECTASHTTAAWQYGFVPIVFPSVSFRTTHDLFLVWPRRFCWRQAVLRVVIKARSLSLADDRQEDFDRKIWDKNIRAEQPEVGSYLPVPNFPVYIWLRHDRAGFPVVGSVDPDERKQPASGNSRAVKQRDSVASASVAKRA